MVILLDGKLYGVDESEFNTLWGGVLGTPANEQIATWVRSNGIVIHVSRFLDLDDQLP